MNPDLHGAVAELEDYLDGVPAQRAAELVRPFATRWVLPELGFDLARLTEETQTFVAATPLSDRILSSYLGHVTYWVSQRMLLDAQAPRRVQRARALLETRADELGDEFPRVAAGMRRSVERGDEALLEALAERIAETAMP
jgi:hypothetical protein